MAKQAALAKKQISDVNSGKKMMHQKMSLPSHLKELEYDIMKLEKQLE